jgi:hypothetical protein
LADGVYSVGNHIAASGIGNSFVAADVGESSTVCGSKVCMKLLITTVEVNALGHAICTNVVINLWLHELNRIDGHELRDVSGGWLASSHVTTAHATRGTSAAAQGRA